MLWVTLFARTKTTDLADRSGPIYLFLKISLFFSTVLLRDVVLFDVLMACFLSNLHSISKSLGASDLSFFEDFVSDKTSLLDIA